MMILNNIKKFFFKKKKNNTRNIKDILKVLDTSRKINWGYDNKLPDRL